MIDHVSGNWRGGESGVTAVNDCLWGTWAAAAVGTNARRDREGHYLEANRNYLAGGDVAENQRSATGLRYHAVHTPDVNDVASDGCGSKTGAVPVFDCLCGVRADAAVISSARQDRKGPLEAHRNGLAGCDVAEDQRSATGLRYHAVRTPGVNDVAGAGYGGKAGPVTVFNCLRGAWTDAAVRPSARCNREGH